MLKRLSIVVLLFIIVGKTNSQEGIPGEVKSSLIQVRDDDTRHNSPVKRPCLLWLPTGYSDSSNSPFFPLLVFLYGSKRSASLSETNVKALKKTGPFYFLSNKTWNGSANYGGQCGQNHFIVFAMQAGNGSATYAKETSYAIGQLLLRYRIDANRIIISGINEGATTLLHYIEDSTIIYQPRMVIPMSISNALGGGSDAKYNQSEGDRQTVLTITAGTNCCWNKYFDPAFKQAGTDSVHQLLNIYEWIMKNISWGDPSPPLYACDEYVITPYKLAGWLSAGKKTKKEVFGARCSIPVYTINGKINKSSITYLQKSGDNIPGNNLHYGYSPKLKGAIANRRVVIDAQGKVIAIE